MKEILLVGSGGFVGAVARFLVSRVFAGSAFPLATLTVNVVGSICIGFIAERFSTHPLQKEVTLFCTVGFLGAFTTFSAFSYETIALIRDQQLGFALTHVVGSLVLCLGGTVAGFWLGSVLKG